MSLANSLERIKQYLDVEHEPAPTANGVPPAYWPASGDLKVDRLSARYSEVSTLRRVVPLLVLALVSPSQNGPRVLHEVSFKAKSGERIGIGELHLLHIIFRGQLT